MNKPGELDLLTPAINYSDKLTNLTYYRNSGYYEKHGLIFAVTAPDDIIIHREKPIPNGIVVGLMHEEINGVYTEYNYSYSGERFDNNKLTKDDFKGMDLVLLGHIHQRQLLTPRAGYGGSLIQQNAGESHNDHGYTIWDLNAVSKEVKSTFKNIPNENGYLVMKYDNNTNITKMPIPEFPNHVSIEHINCSEEFIKNEHEIIKSKYKNIRNIRNMDVNKSNEDDEDGNEDINIIPLESQKENIVKLYAVLADNEVSDIDVYEPA
jgi:DNA repair exonuclease SbcCD nuclease subunit